MPLPDPQKLPEARLVPKDGADRMAILRGRATDGARKVGRVALTVTKAFAVLALCSAGIGAISAVGSRSRTSHDWSRDWELRSQTTQRLNETLKSIRAMPRTDFGTVKPRPLKVELHADGASPSQAATSRP